jgi:flagellin-like hook-associated protein FlgL
MPLQIDRTAAVQTQIAGSNLFAGTVEGENVDVFTVMADLTAAIQLNAKDTTRKTQIDDQIRKLQKITDNLLAVARTNVGGYVNFASRVENDLGSAKIARETQLSHEEAADLATAISELTISQNGLQATLAVGARVSQLSILDYLK